MVEVAKLEEILTAWMRRYQTPGLAVGVAQDHGMVLLRGFGQTSVEEGSLPVTERTLFRIASTTKMLVGTALMRLVEQRILALDVPLSTYLPWLHLSQPGVENQITLRHLLSHTSGLCHFPADFTSRDPDGLEVWAHEYLPAYPIFFPPGQVWLYSNAGLALAAYIAQVVTTMPFAQLMQELLFDPLGMTRTTFDPLVALTYSCALGHRHRPEGGWEVDHQFVQNTIWDPAGGALSNVHDLMQVAWLYLQHGVSGEEHLLSAETIQLMQTPQVRCWTRQEEGYGLTWATTLYQGVPLVRHNGGGVSSFQSAFMLVPTQGVALLLLTNGGSLGNLVPQLLEELLVAPAEEPQPTLSPKHANWPGFCGTYLGLYTGLVEVEVGDQHLCLTRNGKRFVLEQHCQQHYLGKADEDNEVISVGFPTVPGTLSGWIVVDDAPCERLAFRPALSPEPEHWARFVGRYALPGGALMPVSTLSVVLEGQALFLIYGTKHMPCLPITSTTFACDVGVLTFLETADGLLLEFQRTMRAKPIPG